MIHPIHPAIARAQAAEIALAAGRRHPAPPRSTYGSKNTGRRFAIELRLRRAGAQAG
jgi:hypothetical protein